MKTPWKQPWGDRISYSTWKAIIAFMLILVVFYFKNRVLLLATLYYEGISPKDATPAILNQFLLKYQWLHNLSPILVIILTLSIGKIFNMKWFNFKALNWKGVRYTLRAYVLTFLVSVGYSIVLNYFLPEYTKTQNQQLIETMLNGQHPVGILMNVAILTPIWEELAFRGILMKYLAPEYPIVGFLASTILFVFAHLHQFNWIDFTTYFIIALAISLVYWRLRKIEYPILFHIFQNSIAAFIMLNT